MTRMKTTRREYESTYTRAAEIIAALMRKPCTRRDLCDILGIDYLHNRASLIAYLREFRASGVVYRSDYDENGAEVLSLQPSLFANPDACVPRGRPQRGGNKGRLVTLTDGRQMTATTAARVTGYSRVSVYNYARSGMQVPMKGERR